MVATLPVRPNFVLFLTDDQDLLLGGWTPMRQAQVQVAEAGASASHWFVHTPVCCPSRVQLLTGRYFHNLRVDPAHGGCMHADPARVHPVSLAAALGAAGYTVGWFGKHMNACPALPPAGFGCATCWWFANGGGEDVEPGGYLNASFHDRSAWAELPSANGTYVASTGGEFGGYTTAILGNKSLAWLRALGRRPRPGPGGEELPPFWLTVAPKAPHAPFTPAPWYDTAGGGSPAWVQAGRAPRGPPFNASAQALADFHPLIAEQVSH